MVVLGHTPTPDWLKTFIFAFHMPLFFFLSGLVYHDGKARTEKMKYGKRSVFIFFKRKDVKVIFPSW